MAVAVAKLVEKRYHDSAGTATGTGVINLNRLNEVTHAVLIYSLD